MNLDVPSWPKMRTKFTDIFLSKTQDEWIEVFKNKDACFAPVMGLDEAADHPHNKARSSFTRGRTGSKEFWEPKPAPKLSRTPARDNIRLQPKTGEHTVEVLLQEGFPKTEIDELLGDKIIAQYTPSASL